MKSIYHGEFLTNNGSIRAFLSVKSIYHGEFLTNHGSIWPFLSVKSIYHCVCSDEKWSDLDVFIHEKHLSW